VSARAGVATLARKAAKAAVLPIGIRAPQPGDLTILLYHRVWRHAGPTTREVDVAAAAFDRQMASLGRTGGALSIDDALAPLLAPVRDGALGEGPVAGGKDMRTVVTFDDGFGDFVEVALPSLVDHQVPATLYLTTGLVNGRDSDARARLSWADLADAVETGLVTIGAHTHTHPDLSRSSEPEAREEMQRSKDLIEDRLGVECRHFAYPYSKSSPAAERVARELFDSGALAWGTNRAGRVDLHRLARVPVLRSDGALFFRAKVRGRLDGEALVYRALRRGPWSAS
jgi:peptidoglycan/xylan/chitin deacetylase (PgdA/CDA1 family)